MSYEQFAWLLVFLSVTILFTTFGAIVACLRRPGAYEWQMAVSLAFAVIAGFIGASRNVIEGFPDSEIDPLLRILQIAFRGAILIVTTAVIVDYVRDRGGR